VSSVLLRSSSVTHQPLTEHKRSSDGADDKKQLLIFIRIVIKVHFPACRSQKYTNQSYKLKQTWCELRPAPFKLRDTPAFDGAQTEFRRSRWQEAIAYTHSNYNKGTFSSMQKSKIHKSIILIKANLIWTLCWSSVKAYLLRSTVKNTKCLVYFLFFQLSFLNWYFFYLAKGLSLFAWFLFPNTKYMNRNSSCWILSLL